MSTTTDLSQFGYREIKMASELLNAWVKNGLPDDFEHDEVTVMMNTNSGNVFLTNSEYQVAMMNGDSLESFYTCPECGHEGFKDEMHHDGGSECRRYLREIGAGETDDEMCECGHSRAEHDDDPDPDDNSGCLHRDGESYCQCEHFDLAEPPARS